MFAHTGSERTGRAFWRSAWYSYNYRYSRQVAGYLFITITKDLASHIRIILKTEFTRAHRIFSKATAITGVSAKNLEWGLGLAGRKGCSKDKWFPLGFSVDGYNKSGISKNNPNETMSKTEKGIHRLIPGITGWAQVNGRDELPIPVKVEFDEYYLKNRSFLFDLKILWMTFAKVVKREGVTH